MNGYRMLALIAAILITMGEALVFVGTTNLNSHTWPRRSPAKRTSPFQLQFLGRDWKIETRFSVPQSFRYRRNSRSDMNRESK